MSVDPKKLKRNTLRHVKKNVFWICRGDKITNIHDLANCVESLDDAAFQHHVNPEKNDIALWIHDVLKNPLLAHDVNLDVNVHNKAHFVKTIRDHVAWLEKL